VEYRKLGKTDLEVSVISMGGWALAGDHVWGEQDTNQSEATIHAAMDVGINFFDTAEAYSDGGSESVLGSALKGRRNEVILATKVLPANLAADDTMRACEDSLKRLQTDYIDLYQIHWPNPDVPIDETMDALEKLKTAGKVRYLGVSNFGKRDLGEVMKRGLCVSDQLPYSLLFRAIEYGIQDACVQNGVGILCYSPLAQGLLTGKFTSVEDVPMGRRRTRHYSMGHGVSSHNEEGFEAETFETVDRLRKICEEIGKPMAQVSLAWLFHQEGVDSVIVGARRPEQIRVNAEAADCRLDQQTIRHLAEATEDLKSKLGGNADQYRSEFRIH
jgi:aryl-alcohol dehydrogenase-like predicted oxidoreductase